MLEYKVLVERDKSFSGNFDFEALEKTLNTHAVEGWRVAQSFYRAANLWKSPKAEIVAILERPAGESG